MKYYVVSAAIKSSLPFTRDTVICALKQKFKTPEGLEAFTNKEDAIKVARILNYREYVHPILEVSGDLSHKKTHQHGFSKVKEPFYIIKYAENYKEFKALKLQSADLSFLDKKYKKVDLTKVSWEQEKDIPEKPNRKSSKKIKQKANETNQANEANGQAIKTIAVSLGLFALLSAAFIFAEIAPLVAIGLSTLTLVTAYLAHKTFFAEDKAENHKKNISKAKVESNQLFPAKDHNKLIVTQYKTKRSENILDAKESTSVAMERTAKNFARLKG